jgi:hypothetical protein
MRVFFIKRHAKNQSYIDTLDSSFEFSFVRPADKQITRTICLKCTETVALLVVICGLPSDTKRVDYLSLTTRVDHLHNQVARSRKYKALYERTLVIYEVWKESLTRWLYRFVPHKWESFVWRKIEREKREIFVWENLLSPDPPYQGNENLEKRNRIHVGAKEKKNNVDLNIMTLVRIGCSSWLVTCSWIV